MKLAHAHDRIIRLSGKSFGQFMTEEQLAGIVRNKGKTGQLLEIALGLQLTSNNLDFEDGELKSNKCDRTGKPMETIFVTQISSIIDELLALKSFRETHLYAKLRNMLYVPVSKDGTPNEWMFLQPVHVNLDEPRFAGVRNQLEDDYYSICRQLKRHIEVSKDGYIHTSSGELMQIRSKDMKPYHPIHSSTYRRFVSNKNHAFYLKKDFVHAVRLVQRSR